MYMYLWHLGMKIITEKYRVLVLPGKQRQLLLHLIIFINYVS